MSQKLKEEPNAFNSMLESAGILSSYESLLVKYSISSIVRSGVENLLTENSALSKKYYQGLIEIQRIHKVPSDFVHGLNSLLSTVNKKKTSKKKSSSSKKKKTSVKSKSKKEVNTSISIMAEIAGPTKDGLVLRVVVPWSDILSNIPPELLNDKSTESSGSLSFANTETETDTSKTLVSVDTSKVPEEDLLNRYRSAIMDPSPDSTWEQILFFVTGSDKVSLDQLAAKFGSDRETIRKYLQTEYAGIQKYVEIRLDGDHVSASHK
ncbi:MAG: hypothetical protein ACO3L1_00105 [Flavobacteriaceae bacterium]